MRLASFMIFYAGCLLQFVGKTSHLFPIMAAVSELDCCSLLVLKLLPFPNCFVPPFYTSV